MAFSDMDHPLVIPWSTLRTVYETNPKHARSKKAFRTFDVSFDSSSLIS